MFCEFWMDGTTFILVTIAEDELVRLRVAFSIFNVGVNGSCCLVHDLAPPSSGGVNWTSGRGRLRFAQASIFGRNAVFGCRVTSEPSKFHGRHGSLTSKSRKSLRGMQSCWKLTWALLVPRAQKVACIGGAQHQRVVMVTAEGHHSEGCGPRWFQPTLLHMRGLGSTRAIEEHLNKAEPSSL